ncbi:GH32 C-terminal domain-containing protein [Streptomyces sp. NPDC001966]
MERPARHRPPAAPDRRGLVQRPAAPVALTTGDGERRLRIRLFMDTCAVEVFGGDGRVTISSLLPSPHSRPCP